MSHIRRIWIVTSLIAVVAMLATACQPQVVERTVEVEKEVEVTREVEVECLPGDIPQTLELDVTALEIGAHYEAKDLELPKSVELMVELDKVIVAVAHSRVATEVEEAEAEAAEAGLLEEEAAEPELIGRSTEDEAETEDE